MPAAGRASYQILTAPYQSLNSTFATPTITAGDVLTTETHDNVQPYYTTTATPMHHHHNHHHHAYPTTTTYHPLVNTNKVVHNDVMSAAPSTHIPHRIPSSNAILSPHHHLHPTNQQPISNKSQQQQPPRPSISTVTEHDVLCGRGVNIAHHSGNERFRTLVTGRHDESYCTAYSATEKRAVAEEIIRHIKVLQPPGRFLKRDGRGQVSRGLNGPWEELTDKEAVKKTCQALRDCNRVDRQGYAACVMPPQDVMLSRKQRAMTGMTGKEEAAAAAAANAAAIAASVSMKRSRIEGSPQILTNYPSHDTPEIGDTLARLSPGIESAAEWLKKQRTECGAFTHQLSSADAGMLVAPPPLPTVTDVIQQNVIYDSTHQEFHKVWTQTQPSPAPTPNESLSVDATISKELTSDDFDHQELNPVISHHQELNPEISHHQELNPEISHHQALHHHELISEISHHQALNPEINHHQVLNPEISHHQLNLDMNHHHEELHIVTAPQLVVSSKTHSEPVPSFHHLNVIDSDMQPTPVAALTHPDLPISKHLLVGDGGELDNCVLDSIHHLDQASKLIMSSVKEDALQNVNAVEICPPSPVQLSTDL